MDFENLDLLKHQHQFNPEVRLTDTTWQLPVLTEKVFVRVVDILRKVGMVFHPDFVFEYVGEGVNRPNVLFQDPDGQGINRGYRFFGSENRDQTITIDERMLLELAAYGVTQRYSRRPSSYELLEEAVRAAGREITEMVQESHTGLLEAKQVERRLRHRFSLLGITW
jgi:hypothetical protein